MVISSSGDKNVRAEKSLRSIHCKQNKQMKSYVCAGVIRTMCASFTPEHCDDSIFFLLIEFGISFYYLQ